MNVNARTVDLAAEITGAGPVIVLLHGIGESARSWDPVIAELGRDRTLIAVDLRGHGRSPPGDTYEITTMAEDVYALLQRLGLGEQDVLVIGHSMGGLVALAYAASHPTCGTIVVEQLLNLVKVQDMLRPLDGVLRGDRFAENFVTVFDGLWGELPAEEIERIRTIRRPEQAVVLGVWAPLLQETAEALDLFVRRLLRRVDVPVLVLHGIDPGADYAEWLHERIPTADTELWADHGHYPHLLDPQRFVLRVHEFEQNVGRPR